MVSVLSTAREEAVKKTQMKTTYREALLEEAGVLKVRSQHIGSALQCQLQTYGFIDSLRFRVPPKSFVTAVDGAGTSCALADNRDFYKVR